METVSTGVTNGVHYLSASGETWVLKQQADAWRIALDAIAKGSPDAQRIAEAALELSPSEAGREPSGS